MSLSKRTVEAIVYQRAKRIADAVAAFIAMIGLFPVLAAVAIVIRLAIGSPVLFRQQRPGLHGRPFMLVKFRTMSDGRDVNGNLEPDGARINTVGRILRSTSLDELPELWNILKGEMSFVGPRPLLMSYLPLFTLEQSRRHDVRPGLTGWAQVNGRNAIDWPAKLKMDSWYAEHASLALDLRILLRSGWTVLLRRDINASDGEAMPLFRGEH